MIDTTLSKFRCDFEKWCIDRIEIRLRERKAFDGTPAA
jgi:hypothetical protein